MISTFLDACCQASKMPGQALNPSFDVTAELRRRMDDV